jgi:hypothetical protein
MISLGYLGKTGLICLTYRQVSIGNESLSDVDGLCINQNHWFEVVKQQHQKILYIRII